MSKRDKKNKRPSAKELLSIVVMFLQALYYIKTLF